MELINIICSRLGISQAQLAVLIGSPRTSVSKAAAGHRMLPGKPALKLLNLYTAVNNLEASTAAEETISQPEKEAMAAALNSCRHKQQQWQRQLKKMRTGYPQANALLQTMQALATDNTLTKRQKNWCEELAYKAAEKRTTCGLAAQKILEMKMALLRTEIVFYEELLQQV